MRACAASHLSTTSRPATIGRDIHHTRIRPCHLQQERRLGAPAATCLQRRQQRHPRRRRHLSGPTPPDDERSRGAGAAGSVGYGSGGVHAGVVVGATAASSGSMGTGALTTEQQMAVTQVVATLVPLPLPRPLATQVIGQVVGNLSQSLAQNLTPELRRKLARGKALSEAELDSVAAVMAEATDVPLIDSETARPIFRAAAGALFGPEKVQIKTVRIDWGEVLAAGIGLEDEGYRELLAVEMAAAVDIPGLSEKQEQRVANWMLDRAAEVAQRVLPPQLLPVLRASSTEDLEVLRPKLAQALVDGMSKSGLIAGVSVMIPAKTKRAGADLIVDWIYKNCLEDTQAWVQLMTPAQRRKHEWESLHRRVGRLEDEQENLTLQTQLAVRQLWDNHWERERILWLLRFAALRRVLLWALGAAAVLGAAAALCCAAGRPDIVATSLEVALTGLHAAVGAAQTAWALLLEVAWPAFTAFNHAVVGFISEGLSWLQGLAHR